MGIGTVYTQDESNKGTQFSKREPRGAGVGLAGDLDVSGKPDKEFGVSAGDPLTKFTEDTDD